MYTVTAVLLSLACSAPAQDASAIYAKASKATVRIETAEAQGTGFVTGDGSLVVTCYHVIEDGSPVKVEGSAATYVAGDEEADIAVLKLSKKRTDKLTIATGPSPKPGAKVYVLGNPLGLEKSITDGIVSALRRDGNVALLQITAAISHGSSGSPVLDSKGIVVGMARSFVAEGQTLNFAVSAFNLRTTVAKVGKEGATKAVPKKLTEGSGKKKHQQGDADTIEVDGRKLRRATPEEIRRTLGLLNTAGFKNPKEFLLTEEAIEPFVRAVEEGLVRSENYYSVGYYLSFHLEKSMPHVLQMLRSKSKPQIIVAVQTIFAASSDRTHGEADPRFEKPKLKTLLTNPDLIEALTAISFEVDEAASTLLLALSQIEYYYPGTANRLLNRMILKVLDGPSWQAVHAVEAMSAVAKPSEGKVLEQAIKLVLKKALEELEEVSGGSITEAVKKKDQVGSELAYARIFEPLEYGKSPVCTETAILILKWDDDMARSYACRVLALREDGMDARRELEAMLKEDDPHLRGEALTALCTHYRTEYLDRVAENLGAADPIIRACALEAVEAARAVRFKKDILWLSKDKDATVRYASVTALAFLCGSEGQARLKEMLFDEDKKVRDWTRLHLVDQ